MINGLTNRQKCEAKIEKESNIRAETTCVSLYKLIGIKHCIIPAPLLPCSVSKPHDAFLDAQQLISLLPSALCLLP
jgi:hypothetical protein